MHVQTGGKAMPGRQSLWRFNGGATVLDVRGNLLYQITNMTQIAIGSIGSLKADGNLWLTLPDDADKDITPTVAGVDNYTFNVGGQKYPLTILANGNDLSVTSPEFCAGQLVNFTASWGATLAFSNSIQHWTLPQKYVNESYEFSTTCTSYRDNSDLLTSNSTQCWFINGSGGKVSIGMNLQFPNGQTVSIAADGNITIYRPTFSGFVCDGSGFTWSSPALDGNMDWQVTLNSKYDGSFGVTQIINSDYGNSDYYTGGYNYLDGSSEIYGTQLNNGPSQYIATNAATHFITLEDSPHDIAAPCANMMANFSDYLRFQPAGGIFVTISTNGWYMKGSACLLGAISPNDLPPASALIKDDTFPTWYDIRSGGGH